MAPHCQCAIQTRKLSKYIKVIWDILGISVCTLDNIGMNSVHTLSPADESGEEAESSVSVTSEAWQCEIWKENRHE